MTYGAETLTPTNSLKHNLAAALIKMENMLKLYIWREKQTSIGRKLRKAQLYRLHGHVEPMHRRRLY